MEKTFLRMEKRCVSGEERWTTNRLVAQMLATKDPVVVLAGRRCNIATRLSIVILDGVRWAWRIVRDLFRFGQIAVVFSPLIVSSPFAYVFTSTRSRWYDLLARTLEFAGPTWIKLGQWASTRRDLFPSLLCDELSRLHTDVSPVRSAHVEHVVERSFSTPLEDIFSEWDTSPLGSGCISQVHRAVLCTNGEHVAVKVRRPGVRDAIERDLRIIECICAIAAGIPTMEWFSLDECASKFRDIMMSQLDFSIEAKNLKRFASNFEDESDVLFPRVVSFGEVGVDMIHPTDDVLIMSLESGESLSEVMSSTSVTFRKRVARLGLRTFLKMVLHDNFVHGDLHPGNLLVRTRADGNPEMTFLDVGIVAELSSEDRRNFIDLFTAVAKGNGREAGTLLLDRSPENQCDDPEAFVLDIETLIDGVSRKTFNLNDVQIGSVLTSVLSIVRRHRVKLDPNFVSIVISITLLEGIGRQLDPQIDIFKQALPMLMRPLW